MRRRAGWLPDKQEDLEVWLAGHRERTDAKAEQATLHPVIREFQELIDTDAVVRMYVERMIAEVPRSKPYRKRHLKDVPQMLRLINEVRGMAPEFSEDAMVVTPLGAILDWTMGTPTGFAAYRDPRVNASRASPPEVSDDQLDRRGFTGVDGGQAMVSFNRMVQAVDQGLGSSAEYGACMSAAGVPVTSSEGAPTASYTDEMRRLADLVPSATQIPLGDAPVTPARRRFLAEEQRSRRRRRLLSPAPLPPGHVRAWRPSGRPSSTTTPTRWPPMTGTGTRSRTRPGPEGGSPTSGGRAEARTTSPPPQAERTANWVS